MTGKEKALRALVHTWTINKFQSYLMFCDCQSCGSKLWSNFSKEKRLCPECIDGGEELQDLENQLEALQSSQQSSKALDNKNNPVF